MTRIPGKTFRSPIVSSRDASSATMISGRSATVPETTSDCRHVRVTDALLNAGTTIVTSGEGIAKAFTVGRIGPSRRVVSRT